MIEAVLFAVVLAFGKLCSPESMPLALHVTFDMSRVPPACNVVQVLFGKKPMSKVCMVMFLEE